VNEQLDITPLGRYSLIEVRYTLRNQSDKNFSNLHYGFPVDYYGSGACRSVEYRDFWWDKAPKVEGWSDAYVRKVSFALNGTQLPYQCSADSLIRPRRSFDEIQVTPTMKDSLMDDLAEDYIWENGFDTNTALRYLAMPENNIFSYESEIYRRWYYTTFSIGPRQEVELLVRYQIINDGDIEEEVEHTIFEPIEVYYGLYYDFSPAAYWGNGKADHLEINCHAHLCTADYVIHDKNYNFIRTTLVGDDWQYTADNFDLASAQPLDIRFQYWRRNWHNYRKRRLSPDNYVLSLSCEDAKYPITNLSDTNVATAAVIHPDGKGRTYICIKLREPQVLSGLVIVGGYAKSRNTWIDNGRINSIKMVVYDENGTPLKEAFPWATDHKPYNLLKTSTEYPLNLTTLTRERNAIEIPLSDEIECHLPEGLFNLNYGGQYGQHKISEIRLQIMEQCPGVKSKLLCVSEVIVLDK
ncbi:MAG: hypothetical protein MJZ86_07060, partial [Bacteroidales bacterium]|nr:hypothetical protein [Bacteroidales bacterium]